MRRVNRATVAQLLYSSQHHLLAPRLCSSWYACSSGTRTWLIVNIWLVLESPCPWPISPSSRTCAIWCVWASSSRRPTLDSPHTLAACAHGHPSRPRGRLTGRQPRAFLASRSRSSLRDSTSPAPPLAAPAPTATKLEAAICWGNAQAQLHSLRPLKQCARLQRPHHLPRPRRRLRHRAWPVCPRHERFLGNRISRQIRALTPPANASSTPM